MLTLGIETSTRVCSVALADQGRIVAQVCIDEGLVHSDRLVPLLDDILSRNGLDIRELAGIAVSSGPGSFTGIRIGVASARAAAQILAVPVVGICSLDGLVFDRRKEILLSPMLDALREDVYTSLYLGEKRLDDYLVVPVKERLAALVRRDEDVCFMGEAADIHREIITGIMGKRALIEEGIRASAGNIALLGERRLEKGGPFGYDSVKPVYIRRAWAETVRDRR